MLLDASNLALFIGRFHPLVVHLPIGFLVLAALLEIFSWHTNRFKQAVRLTLFLGFVSAVIAVIFGKLLANDGGYNENLLESHEHFGIMAMVLSFVTWLIHTEMTPIRSKLAFRASLWIMLGLVSLAGHLGGGLTHGENYLTQYAPFFKKATKTPTIPQSADSVNIYAHLIEPILAKNCVTCHNDGKTNGGLNMVSFEKLQKGGDNGAVITTNDAHDSELFHRITMDNQSEKFMPPDGRRPLNYNDIQLIAWWINTDATDTAMVSEVETTDEIKAILLKNYELDTRIKPLVETLTAPAISPEALEAIKAKGFAINQLADGNNLVEITATDAVTADMLETLLLAKDQITWLNLSDTDLTDDGVKIISQLPMLTRLRIEKNPISEVALTYLEELAYLESLNIYATPITDKALESIKNMAALKRVYLWQTKTTKEGIDILKQSRPKLEIDTGFSFPELEN